MQISLTRTFISQLAFEWQNKVFAMRKPVSDQQLNQLNPALGNNHVICFETMEIRKCLQEMRYDRLNSSTVAWPKYDALTYKTNSPNVRKTEIYIVRCQKKLNITEPKSI